MMLRLLGFLLCITTLIACGGRPPISTTMPIIELDSESSQSTLIRAGWWRVVGGDFTGAKKLFQRSGEHPWARLGLGYLARMKMDPTRTDTLLTPLRSESSGVGEIARSWSVSSLGSPWQPLLPLGDEVRRSKTPYLELETPSKENDKTARWTVASTNIHQNNTLVTARHLKRRNYKISPKTKCIRVRSKEPFAVDWKNSRRFVFEAPTRFFPVHEAKSTFAAIWIKGDTPAVYQSESPCDAFRLNRPSYLKPDEDELLWVFLRREMMLINGETDQLLLHDDGQPNLISQPWRIQILSALLSKGAIWHAIRRQHIVMSEDTPSTRLNFLNARHAHLLGDHHLAWRTIEKILPRKTDNQEILALSIGILSGLNRQTEARFYTDRYLQIGTPQCQHLDTILGALGEESSRIDVLIDLSASCGRLNIAIEQALRWLRVDKAQKLAKLLGSSEVDQQLKYRVQLAGGELGESDETVVGVDEIKRTDIRHLVSNSLPTDQSLERLRHQYPNDGMSIRLSGWFSPTSQTPKHMGVGSDSVDRARVLQKATEVSVDREGQGHQVHQEQLRIDHHLGVRDFGEIGIPEDALLPQIEILKPNGRRIFPLDNGEKGTFSLPSLEVGDILDVQFTQPILHNAGTSLEASPIFRESLPYARVDLSKFHLFRPKNLNWVMTTSKPSESTTSHEIFNRQVSSVESIGLHRTWTEPLGSPVQFLGQLRRWHHPSLESTHFRQLANRFEIYRRTLAPMHREHCRSPKFDQGDMHRLMETMGKLEISADLEDLGGLAHAALLSRCLSAKNVPHKVALLSPWASVTLPMPLRLEDFTYPVFILEEGQLWDAIGQQLAPGLIPYSLRDTDGRIIFPRARVGDPYSPPLVSNESEERLITIELSKASDNRIHGTVTDELKGADAYLLKAHLHRGDENTLYRVGRRLLDRIASTAQLKQVKVVETENVRLKLKYEFSVFASQAIEIQSFARRPASTYAKLVSRETDLFVDQPIYQRVIFKLSKDVSLAADLTPKRISKGPNQFRISTHQDGQEVRVSLRLDRQKVNASVYDGFRQWCLAVEAQESIPFRLRSR